MKKLLFYATALLSLATAIGGCTAEDVIDLLIPDITIKQPGIYPGEGGEYSIAPVWQSRPKALKGGLASCP